MAKESSKTGLGLRGILTIIFVIAKLTGNFDYSWWWVFAPLWIPALIILGIMGALFVISLIAALLE